MAYAPHLFENLHLNKNNGRVDGITSGLDIAGQGTFKFTVTDDNGKAHTIKISNSLYVPNLKRCLLPPHHSLGAGGWRQANMDGESQE
jgi:hypothetical protein